MALWLIRHARPLIAPGVCYGALDVPAEDAHTRQVAQQLAAALPQGLTLRSSPRQRCQQLATALTQLRPDLDCLTDGRLAEMDFGHWEGQTWDAIGATALADWTRDFAHHRPGGGESVQAFLARVDAARQDSVRSGEEAVWLTHAGVIRAVGLLAQGLPATLTAEKWPRTAPGFGGWLRLP